ncbi:hypothetical protein [Mitsuokella multacida]|uniref:hypothetical protein n=1 Tax=Mitsuokella multacida TaxID=52226 RepID=UPI00241CE0F2|nr:hypothetical protein [Mitsuokella multacida]
MSRMNGKNDRESESWLSAALKPMDGVIAIAAICILSVMDFSKMETVDWILTVTIVIWFVLTLVRCYIYYRKSR